MDEYYFDFRERRYKPIPDCSRYGLSWVAESQRCEYLNCFEQIMNFPGNHYYQYHDDDREENYQEEEIPLMGFAQGDGGGDGDNPLGAIIAGIGAAFGAITGLFGGQRRKDEAASDVALSRTYDGANVILQMVIDNQITEDQAREMYRTGPLQAFIEFHEKLETESVRTSRLTNTVRDLLQAFEDQLTRIRGLKQSQAQLLPAPAPAVTPVPSDSGAGAGDDTGFDDSGYLEHYGEDGSYYYEEPDGSYYYEDAAGNYYQGDAEGNLYSGNSAGEYWQTDTEGNFYYEAPDGSYYYEDPAGNWSSVDGSGNQCDGDPTGAFTCSDGSSGADYRQSPARQTRQIGTQRKQTQIQQPNLRNIVKQGIALISKARRAQTNAQTRQTARGSGQASRAQESIRSMTLRSTPGVGSSDSQKTILLVGGLLVGLFVLNRLKD